MSEKDIPKVPKVRFEIFQEMFLYFADRSVHDAEHSQEWHGVEGPAAVEWARRYRREVQEFVGHPLARQEHERIENTMLDSWQLRRLTFGYTD